MAESRSKNGQIPGEFQLPPVPSRKLALPPVHRWDVPRPRLFQHLNEGVVKKLTLLEGPDGVGKTILVAQWARQTPVLLTRVALEPEDNDPTRFLRSVVAALQHIDPHIDIRVLDRLRAQENLSAEVILKTLIQDISRIGKEFILFLDDYHKISAPPVHHMVTYVLEHAPSRLHMMIAGHTDPPLPLARLRSTNQLKEIRDPYFRFTVEEVTTLLNSLMSLKLPYGTLSALVQRTRALPLTVKYAGHCLRQGASREPFVESLEHTEEEPLEFCLNMVLKQLPSEMRDFVRQLTVSDYMSPDLARAITSRKDAGELLMALSRQGLFFDLIEPDAPWYRWHSPVRKLLYSSFKAQAVRQIKDLHLRACLWHIQQGELAEAFRHAIEAEDYDLAAQFIEGNAQILLENGYLITVQRWLRSIPEAVFASRPMLCICQAWVYIITREYDRVEPYLAQALEGRQASDNPEDIARHVRAIQEYLARAR